MSIIQKRIFKAFIGTLVTFCCFFFISIMSAFFDNTTVVVGAKNCAENRILGEIIAQLIESKTDLKVKRKLQLEGTNMCFQSLISGDIDLYVEYTGTALQVIFKDQKSYSSFEAVNRVRELFEKHHSLIWTEPLGFVNSYVFIMKKDHCNRKKINNLTDLFSTKDLSIGMDPEFYSRDECVKLQKSYSWKTSNAVRLFDHAMLFVSLENTSIDACVAFATEGLAQDDSLLFIEDDKKVLPAYLAAPVVRKDLLEKYPQLKPIFFKTLSNIISEEKMRQMNYEAEKKGMKEYDIARKFLLINRLI